MALDEIPRAPGLFLAIKAAADLPGRFVRGIVLYTGSETVSFGERLVACPVEPLWGLPERR